MPNNENQLPATSSPYPEADNNQVLLPLDVARVVTSFMTENDLFHIEPIGKLSDRNYQKILQLNTRTNLVTAMLLEKREGTTPSKSYIKHYIDEMNVIQKKIEEIEQEFLCSTLRIAFCCPNAVIQLPISLLSIQLYIVTIILFTFSGMICMCPKNWRSFILEDLFCYEKNVYYHYKFKGDPWKRNLTGLSSPPPLCTHPRSCPALFFAPIAQTLIGCQELLCSESNEPFHELHNSQKFYSKPIERYYALMAPSSCGMI